MWRSTEKLWDATDQERRASEAQRVADAEERRLDRLQFEKSLGIASKNAEAAVKAADATCLLASVTESGQTIANRPYVTFGTIENQFGEFDKEKPETLIPWIVRVNYGNIGRTPAIKVKGCACGFPVIGRNSGPKKEYPLQYPDDYWPDIAASQGKHLEIHLNSFMWSLAASEHGEYYIYGAIEYESILEPSRRLRSEFCYQVRVSGRLDLPNEERGAQIAMTIGAVGPHNGSDERCYYKPQTT